jgi:hypothetical protein
LTLARRLPARARTFFAAFAAAFADRLSIALAVFAALALAEATFLRAAATFLRSAARDFCSAARASLAFCTAGDAGDFALLFLRGLAAAFFLGLAIVLIPKSLFDVTRLENSTEKILRTSHQ